MAIDREDQPREVVLELPPLPEFVGTGRLVVAAMARHYGFGDEQAEDLKIAVSEAITNSVRAHINAGIGDPVRLSIRLVDGRLVIEVSDRGAGFNPAEELQLGTTPVSGTLEGGLGLMLIRALITDTVIERRQPRGMLIRMTLKREVAAGIR